MATLEKAKLFRLSNDKKDTELEEIPVQFNPASLKLTLSNSTEGGSSRGRTARQYMGTAATELAFDLVFDTADEAGPDGAAVSVRERTRRIEQFVLSQGSGGKRQAPPRVKFQWGGMELKGVISTLAVDFDLFAANGFPLRAKMSVSIKEQNAEHELGKSEEGDAPAPQDPPAAGPGSEGSGDDHAAAALEGESAADFAARMGLDPAAWRGLAAGLENTLSLAAGVELGFSASLGLSAGIGLSLGFEAGVDLSLEARLGLEAGVGARGSASAGFALSAAGGVDAAVNAAAIARTSSAAAATVQAFGGGAAGGSATAVSASTAAPAAGGAAAAPASGPAALAPAPPAGGAPGSAARSAVRGGSPASAEALPTAPAPRVDARAASFGLGVPLRPARSPGRVAGTPVALRPYGRASLPPAGDDPASPPWERLPAPRSAAPGAPRPAPPASTPAHRAGCGCGCGPGVRGGGR
jgi:hypothetical protein